MEQDIIRLLPDTLANQIAAGEVIQRPASAVKEMLENAVDAGATEIHLIIKDAGKELIQVMDNGKGMSVTDARLCFERHATSKIKTQEDLFRIHTMGFRGEALASIAAVARVELKTKTGGAEIGTRIHIENGSVIGQEACQTPEGTSLSVKNLFYNVPARRNFLKSNTTEMRHILDEFTHVALAFPQIKFRFTNNNTDLYILEQGNLKQRIIQLLGSSYQKKLLPVEEETEFVGIRGFCGTPEASGKTRGNQYFFVNNRYIKSAYLNHAVNNAYAELLSKDEFPFFVLFVDIEPARVDVNVHPTKQEIKFEDDKVIYAFVKSAITHSLGKFSIVPSIDFNLDSDIQNLSSVKLPMNKELKEKTQNDFLFQSFTQRGQAHRLHAGGEKQNWEALYKIREEIAESAEVNISTPPVKFPDEQIPEHVHYFQVDHSYIVFKQEEKLFLIHQQYAHERVLYEEFLKASSNPLTIQKCLIPQTWELNPQDALLVEELTEEFRILGYEIEAFGKNTFIIQGIPADVQQGNEKASLESALEAFKHEAYAEKLDKRERLIRTLARQKCLKVGKKLFEKEMEELARKLFACQIPTHSPDNKKTMLVLSSLQIEALFGQ